MQPLETLFQTIERELRNGRIGRPVCVRGHLELSADHGRLLPALAGAAQRALEWLGEGASRVFAAGSIEAGHVCTLIEGRGGPACLLSIALRRRSFPVADILVIGNQGSLRHEGLENGLSASVEAVEAGRDALSEAARAMLTAIERSLESAAPVDVDDAGRRK
jgi:hypothetical protein